MEITKSKSLNVVCRLGGFHLLISFLGSIGKVMEYSGILELFQVVDSSATAVHILLGKAYVRALQSHFLIQFAQEPIIFQFISPLSLIEQLSTMMLKENIYVIQVTEMMISFQMKYQSMLLQVTLRIYVPQWSKLNKAKTKN